MTLAARERINAIENTHYAVPLRAYDHDGNIIPPVDYERSLLGAVVCVDFTLFHGSTPQHDHVYTAYIDSLNVLEPPLPRSPDLSLPDLRARDVTPPE